MIGLRTVPYADPEAQELIAQVQLEYLQRYGETDQTPVQPDEFVPPAGLFLLAFSTGSAGSGSADSDVPVGCGGWRAHRAGVAEIKRMYVVAAHRRRGVARALLAELERTAAQAGYRWLELCSRRLRGGECVGAHGARSTRGDRDVPGSGIPAGGRLRSVPERAGGALSRQGLDARDGG